WTLLFHVIVRPRPPRGAARPRGRLYPAWAGAAAHPLTLARRHRTRSWVARRPAPILIPILALRAALPRIVRLAATLLHAQVVCLSSHVVASPCRGSGGS